MKKIISFNFFIYCIEKVIVVEKLVFGVLAGIVKSISGIIAYLPTLTLVSPETNPLSSDKPSKFVSINADVVKLSSVIHVDGSQST